jgi:hypothetical protein
MATSNFGVANNLPWTVDGWLLQDVSFQTPQYNSACKLNDIAVTRQVSCLSDFSLERIYITGLQQMMIMPNTFKKKHSPISVCFVDFAKCS